MVYTLWLPIVYVRIRECRARWLFFIAIRESAILLRQSAAGGIDALLFSTRGKIHFQFARGERKTFFSTARPDKRERYHVRSSRGGFFRGRAFSFLSERLFYDEFSILYRGPEIATTTAAISILFFNFARPGEEIFLLLTFRARALCIL